MLWKCTWYLFAFKIWKQVTGDLFTREGLRVSNISSSSCCLKLNTRSSVFLFLLTCLYFFTSQTSICPRRFPKPARTSMCPWGLETGRPVIVWKDVWATDTTHFHMTAVSEINNRASPVVGSISGSGSKIEHGVTFEVKDGGFGGHEAIDHTELCRVWTPGDVVDRTILRWNNTQRRFPPELMQRPDFRPSSSYSHDGWIQLLSPEQKVCEQNSKCVSSSVPTELHHSSLSIHTQVMQRLLSVIWSSSRVYLGARCYQNRRTWHTTEGTGRGHGLDFLHLGHEVSLNSLHLSYSTAWWPCRPWRSSCWRELPSSPPVLGTGIHEQTRALLYCLGHRLLPGGDKQDRDIMRGWLQHHNHKLSTILTVE